ncbi:GIY-YIG nuclease family protein [Haliscomenobacter sp.]|uniref:GIY-YIG nuclease family protein n=1 Tax=Haliscomenobacter sp. TaxID=2717303 RepID=UPI00336521B0
MHIYKITNLVTNKIYIGQTIQKNPKMRWYSHQADTREGKNTHLYNSMRKYGVDKFLWEVIDSADSLNELNLKEQHWLDEYRKTTEVYNLREAGNNKTHSEQSKEKMKESQKQAHARRRASGTDTWVRRDGGAMKGKAHPRKGTKGLWHYSEEQKKAQSERMNVLNGTRGKTWTIIEGKRIYTEKKL